MTQDSKRVDPARLAQALIRLGSDPDFALVQEHYGALYEELKEQLVTADPANFSVHSGRAMMLRQLLAEVRGARATLERLATASRGALPHSTQ